MSARVQRAVPVRRDPGRANAPDPRLPDPRPARSLPARILLVAVGTGISSYGYLMTAVAGVGNGPLFAVQDGIQRHLGIAPGTASILIGLAIAALAASLRAPLGIGTLVIPIVSGIWINALEPVVVTFEPLAARWVAFLVGTAVMMFGAVLSVGAALGASAIDGVMLSLARIARRTPALVRIAMEISMAVLGIAIGGRVGLGTAVMGVAVGPLFGFWSTQLSRWGLDLSSATSGRHGTTVAE